MLAARLPEFQGCIGHIDGTLVQIRRPSSKDKKKLHKKWYNGRKAMYAFNNTVIIDHDGLFIYIDPGYPGSFHDVNILRASDFHANWRDYFRHDDEYFEYVLGDPGYIGEEMYIMRRVDRREATADGDLSVADAFNAMHAGYRVKVEWGIGGLKPKWRRFMKLYDASHQNFPHLFRAATVLTNFLQRRRHDMAGEVGQLLVDDVDWGGDF